MRGIRIHGHGDASAQAVAQAVGVHSSVSLDRRDGRRGVEVAGVGVGVGESIGGRCGHIKTDQRGRRWRLVQRNFVVGVPAVFASPQVCERRQRLVVTITGVQGHAFALRGVGAVGCEGIFRSSL